MMSLVLDNPRNKEHNIIQNSLVGKRTGQTEVNLTKKHPKKLLQPQDLRT